MVYPVIYDVHLSRVLIAKGSILNILYVMTLDDMEIPSIEVKANDAPSMGLYPANSLGHSGRSLYPFPITFKLWYSS